VDNCPARRVQRAQAIDLEERLVELLVDHEVDLISRPHIVVCTYATGSSTYIGPFPDAAAAIAAARREDDALRSELPDLPVEVWIAALEPDPGVESSGPTP
jgi:hypothetical protein